MAQLWQAVLDPDEIRAFGVNWAPQLASGVTITLSSWDVSQGTVTIVAESTEATRTAIKLSGGVVGEMAYLVNTVTLSNGERYQQTGIVRVQSR